MLPANRELAGAEVELVEFEQRERRLKQAFAAVATEYDFILIDCPPSLSLLTVNGLTSAHGVIIPMQCEYFALEGLSDLVNTIKRVHANLNPDLQIIGLLRVMFDPRMTLQQQVSDQLESHFGDKVFRAVIPRNVRLAEAPSHGIPGVVYDRSSRGAQAYLSFGARDDRAHGQAARRDGVNKRPKGLGRGLEALLGDDPASRPVAAETATASLPLDEAARRPLPAAYADGRDGARRAGRLDPRAGRDPADPRAAGRGRAATRSSPANGASARRSSPGSPTSRSSCATLPTRRRSRWR